MRAFCFARLGPQVSSPFVIFLIVFSFIFTVSTQPADQQLSAAQLNLQEQEISITSNATALSSSNLRVKFEWAQETIDEQSLQMSALLCTGNYATRDPGEKITAPQICYQPKFGKVAVYVDGVPYKGQPQNLLREYLILGIQKGHEHIVKHKALYKLIVRLYDDTGFKGSVTFARYDPPREAIDRLDDGTTLITSPVEGQNIVSNIVNPRPGSPADAPLSILVQQKDARTTTASPKTASSVNDITYTYDIRNTGEGLTLRAYTVGALDSFVAFSEYNAPARDIVIQDFEHSPRQDLRLPELAITLSAGYKSVIQRPGPPFFTASALISAMVQIPVTILDMNKPFESFFKCRIAGDTQPMGDFWVQDGVNPEEGASLSLLGGTGAGNSTAKM